LLLESGSGGDALIAELIETFNTGAAARIRQIGAAFAVSGLVSLRTQAHTIKGDARQVGSDAVADASQELETVSKLPEAETSHVGCGCIVCKRSLRMCAVRWPPIAIPGARTFP